MDLDSIVAMLGFNLPKIYAVNRFTEWAQAELKILGYWDQVAPFSIALPFIIAIVLSAFGESGDLQVIESGLLYGALAIALHHIRGEPDDNQP